ncbi:MAG TPA: hypothetical protein VFS26_01655, partial [Solirubrobacterales bacterium]|nr:hypothetical protein [Solirubrobacterales bacterium]
TSGAIGMQTMDADLAHLVRSGRITRSLAEQRSSVPEELKRVLGGEEATAPSYNGGAQAGMPLAQPPSYVSGS